MVDAISATTPYGRDFGGGGGNSSYFNVVFLPVLLPALICVFIVNVMTFIILAGQSKETAFCWPIEMC